MNNSYRIIKLKSGDDVITRIKGKEGDKLIVEKPMIFKSNIVNDLTGIPKEVTILQKWSKYAKNMDVKIPVDYIVSYLIPIEEAVHLYNLEKNRDDKEAHIRKQSPPTKPNTPNSHDINTPGSADIIRKLLDDIMDFKSMHGPSDQAFKFIGDDKDLEEILDNFQIDINFFAGDMGDLFENMDAPHEEINENEYTGDDVNHPDYGNRWTDWDYDLEDYFNKE